MSSNTDTYDDLDLDNQEWYHGLLPRSEMAALLKNEGEWLVRTTITPNQQKCHVISVKQNDELKHVLVEKAATGNYICQHKTFKNIGELITYFRNSGETVSNKEGGIHISGKPVPRRKWMIRTRDVIKEKKIGGGAFGEVFIGKLKYMDKQLPVAIKTIKVDCADKEKTDEFMREAKLMMHYMHKNVIRFYGVAADQSPLLLLMELCPNGSLDKHLQKNKGTITIEQKTQYSLDAARGMAYLSERKKCIHRDLAARNCLLGVHGEVKIADFGLSVSDRPGDLDPKQHLPIKWFAPEAIKNLRCTFESDVWSYATMMWEIFSDGEEPWNECSPRDAFLNNKNGIKLVTPPGMPPAVEAVMHSCWNLEPSQRPKFAEIAQKLENIISPKSPPKSPAPAAADIKANSPAPIPCLTQYGPTPARPIANLGPPAPPPAARHDEHIAPPRPIPNLPVTRPVIPVRSVYANNPYGVQTPYYAKSTYVVPQQPYQTPSPTPFKMQSNTPPPTPATQSPKNSRRMEVSQRGEVSMAARTAKNPSQGEKCSLM